LVQKALQHFNQVNGVCVTPSDVRGAVYPLAENGKHSKDFGYIQKTTNKSSWSHKNPLVIVYLNGIKTFGQSERCK